MRFPWVHHEDDPWWEYQQEWLFFQGRQGNLCVFLAAPMRRYIPSGAVCFVDGVPPGHADVVKNMIAELAQIPALTTQRDDLRKAVRKVKAQR
jgi:hypothetical protein